MHYSFVHIRLTSAAEAGWYKGAIAMTKKRKEPKGIPITLTIHDQPAGWSSAFILVKC